MHASELPDDYVITPVLIPDDLSMQELTDEHLPEHWDSAITVDAPRDVGTLWARNLSAVTLSVPSVVIPRERNFLINPRHPDFHRLRFLDHEPFHFDERFRRFWMIDRGRTQ